MRRTLSLLGKSIVTGVLALVLIAPLSAIRAMVEERQALSESVASDIASSGVRAQRLVGPLLIVPYRKTTLTEVVDPLTRTKSLVPVTESGQLHFLPEKLDVRAQVDTSTRQRGIYSALLFRARHIISGAFSVPEGLGVESNASITYEWGTPHLVVGVEDTRGILGTPTLAWDGLTREWAGGTQGRALANGIHAELPALAGHASRHAFSIALDLQGTDAIAYVPVGKATSVAMKASWPHPSFRGQFLPDSRTITAQAFEANWRTSHLASNIEDALDACLRESCGPNLTSLGVAFIEPVDVYLQSERAAKYGFLFIGITFVVFLLFELLEKLAIHPIQYGLVGVALALFFLLLLALAEHVPFALAYGVASAACIGLLGFYVSFVLRSPKRALGFTALLSVLYGSLYVLLRSEDMALLLGAGLLFSILAAIMYVTRRVDWYRISADAEAA